MPSRRTTTPVVTAVAVLAALAVGPLAVAAPSGAVPAEPRERVVLGSADFLPGPYDRGFGEVRPSVIDNGGVPSGVVKRVRWRHWGTETTKGAGRTFIYRPDGGYYDRPVRARLRVSDLGRCPGTRVTAYRHLDFRVPKRPGGPLGPWRPWTGAASIC